MSYLRRVLGEWLLQRQPKRKSLFVKLSKESMALIAARHIVIAAVTLEHERNQN